MQPTQLQEQGRPTGGLFGVPLEAAAAESPRGVPWLVTECCDWLLRSGLYAAPDLFLYKSTRWEVYELARAFDSLTPVDALCIDDIINGAPGEEKPHVVAHVLILYLLYLPNALIPSEMIETLLDAIYFAPYNIKDEGEIVVTLFQRIASRLPRPIFLTLTILMYLWKEVANRSNPEEAEALLRQLATTLFPVLVKKNPTVGCLQNQACWHDARLSVRATELMILHSHTIFPPLRLYSLVALSTDIARDAADAEDEEVLDSNSAFEEVKLLSYICENTNSEKGKNNKKYCQVEILKNIDLCPLEAAEISRCVNEVLVTSQQSVLQDQMLTEMEFLPSTFSENDCSILRVKCQLIENVGGALYDHFPFLRGRLVDPDDYGFCITQYMKNQIKKGSYSSLKSLFMQKSADTSSRPLDHKVNPKSWTFTIYEQEALSTTLPHTRPAAPAQEDSPWWNFGLKEESLLRLLLEHQARVIFSYTFQTQKQAIYVKDQSAAFLSILRPRPFTAGSDPLLVPVVKTSFSKNVKLFNLLCASAIVLSLLWVISTPVDCRKEDIYSSIRCSWNGFDLPWFKLSSLWIIYVLYAVYLR